MQGLWRNRGFKVGGENGGGEEWLFTVDEKLEILAQARAVLESNGELCKSGRPAFTRSQYRLQLDKIADMGQITRLDLFFKKLEC